MKIMPNTIFMMIGASNCGKTYYCKNVLIPQLESLKPQVNRTKVNISYISSDDIRRELLGESDMDKYNTAMLSSSVVAFDLLYKKLDACMTFPINSEFIIVDTKGTDERFRERVYAMAKEHRYGVVPVIFNYRDYNDYKIGDNSLPDHVRRDIKKTRSVIVGMRKIPVFKGAIHIKEKDFNRLPKLEFFGHDEYINCFVPNNLTYLVVSDIHGCYDEFVKLLSLNKIEVQNHKIVYNEYNKKIVIAGDYIDSGKQTYDMIDFCYNNLEDIYIVIGNHENRLYKELRGELEHIEEKWFDTYDKMKDDEENKNYKNKFLTIFEKSYPYIWNDFMIVTHAPCSIKYLGKIDSTAKSRQRYYKKEDNAELSFYEEMKNKLDLYQQELCHMVHIFGHIPVANPGANIKSRMNIDGGCVLGGSLAGIEVSKRGVYKKEVKSTYSKIEKLRECTLPEDINTVAEDLTPEENRRISHMVNRKVNFISGTMSPCDKYEGKIEHIVSAIEYFKDRGITDVVMQKKYMGSRMNMYLFKTNEESYAVSRNGYSFRQTETEDEDRRLDFSPLYDKMRAKLSTIVDWSKTKCVILDGELLPWKAIGNGLVRDFQAVYDNIRAESKFLQETEFEEHFAELNRRYMDSNYLHNRNEMDKKKLKEYYGDFKYDLLKSVYEFNNHNTYLTVEEKGNLIPVYYEQLKLYGMDGELDYKPFAILKIVNEDDSEICYYLDKDTSMTNKQMFDMINDDKCYQYDLSKSEDIEAMKNQFYIYTEDEKCEGVVIKPNKLNGTKTVPYMKVRNPNYLTLIYGYDYQTEKKYKKLYDRKSINKKLKVCIDEWKLGLKLLGIKYSDINLSNNELKSLYLMFMQEEEKETGLDPRL